MYIYIFVYLPFLNGVGTNRLTSLNAFAEMRIDRWPRHRFETFQLPRCGHIESLHEIVQQTNRYDDNQENVRWYADYNQCCDDL